MSTVIIGCVKEHSKLRVKMMSKGYLIGANCRFPRDLREEGMFYEVATEGVKLSGSGRKYFYMVSKSHILKTSHDKSSLSDSHTVSTSTVGISKIFTDESNEECIVCMSDTKSIVFAPCGHYVTCASCSSQCNTCVLCRAQISAKVDRLLINGDD